LSFFEARRVGTSATVNQYQLEIDSFKRSLKTVKDSNRHSGSVRKKPGGKRNYQLDHVLPSLATAYLGVALLDHGYGVDPRLRRWSWM
jgi:hypothetical protein